MLKKSCVAGKKATFFIRIFFSVVGGFWLMTVVFFLSFFFVFNFNVLSILNKNEVIKIK